MRFFDEDIPDIAFDQARIILLPVPYEHSTSYGKGAAKGPEAILSAGPYLEFYDDQFDCEPWQLGVYTSDPVKCIQDPEIFQQTIYNKAAELLQKDKFVIALGGEHTISFGLFRACHERFAELSVLQLDAHSDLRNSFQNSRWSHASVMRRIWELNPNIVPVGIRSQCREERDFVLEQGIAIFYAHRIQNEGLGNNVIRKLQKNVYLTIDVDFFDPSIMPSTGTPEPGGFLWYETIDFLEQVFKQRKIVGIDIVELSPKPDVPHADFLVAKLVYKLLSLKFMQESLKE